MFRWYSPCSICLPTIHLNGECFQDEANSANIVRKIEDMFLLTILYALMVLLKMHDVHVLTKIDPKRSG